MPNELLFKDAALHATRAAVESHNPKPVCGSYRLFLPVAAGFLIFAIGELCLDLLVDSSRTGFPGVTLLAHGFLLAFAAGILIAETPPLLSVPPAGLLPLAGFSLFLPGMAISAMAGKPLIALVLYLLSALGGQPHLGDAGHPG